MRPRHPPRHAPNLAEILAWARRQRGKFAAHSEQQAEAARRAMARVSPERRRADPRVARALAISALLCAVPAAHTQAQPTPSFVLLEGDPHDARWSAEHPAERRATIEECLSDTAITQLPDCEAAERADQWVSR